MHGVLLSGGMDSTVLAFNLAQKYGSQGLIALHAQHSYSTEEETNAARVIAKDLGLELVCGQLVPTVRYGDILPARNMMLVAWAANILHVRGGGELFMGFCREDRDGFADCDEAFVDLCNRTLRHSGCEVFVRAPYAHLRKAEILDLPGSSYAELVSYSCYEEGGPCGECSSCRLRAASLEGGA